MVDETPNVLPVWTLVTEDVTVPFETGSDAMTPERVAELRNVLAAMADTPVATLEAHPLPGGIDQSRGILLDAASPLAKHLSLLISESANAMPAGIAGEALYRMVVPAKFAALVGGGLLKPMTAATGSGIHSALVGPSGIAGHAKFVHVAPTAAGAGAFAIAAPLVLMAVAAGVSANADQKREEAIANITRLLEKLHDDALARERAELNACRSAVDNATAILLDEGEPGMSLGLDSAVKAIRDAVELTRDRLQRWQQALGKFGDKPVEVRKLREAFAGIDRDGGEFRAHLQLAELAIALQKRVIVLQAVEHAQKNPAKSFERFVGRLKTDQENIIKLESEISAVLAALGRLRIDRPHGIRDGMFITAGDVDQLLRTSYRLREFGDGVDVNRRQPDVAIEMARKADGSVVVFPALTA
jgi:hypothetical protein